MPPLIPWTPDFERIDAVVTATPDPLRPIYPQRLDDWRAFFRQHGRLPPLLVAQGGWLVNGHHRLIVARENGYEPDAEIVLYRHPHWVATGNLIRVR